MTKRSDRWKRSERTGIVRLKSWYIYGNTGDACGNSVPHNRSLRMGCASLIDGVITLLSAGFLYPDFAWRCAMKTVRHGIDVEEQRRRDDAV